MDTQLDLFDQKTISVNRAREALCALRLEESRHLLLGLARLYPSDRAVAGELARAQRLFLELSDVEMLPADEQPVALALLLERLAGDRDLLPLRRSLLARASTDDRRLRARLLALAADVEHQGGDAVVARRLYRDALLCDAEASRIDRFADADVRSLPAEAAALGLGAQPVAWAAAVGIVLGVLPAPHGPPAGYDAARAFIRALVHAGDVSARREMRRLAPALFEAYMERFR